MTHRAGILQTWPLEDRGVDDVPDVCPLVDCRE